jgi:choline monooxygenase
MSLEEIIASYDPAVSLDRAFTIPATWYLDPEVAALESRTVFAKSWQVAARSEQLDKPGQYTASEVAGEPVVLVRGSDSVLRGFFNVCRHHAAAVATESAGEAAELRCPYHGWTYALEGHLKSAPDLGSICGFDRRSMGLVPVESARWKRWVLVRVDGGRAAMTDLPGLDVSSYHWFERRRYTLNCNWKVFVDNYLDGGYHVPHLHQGTANSPMPNTRSSWATGTACNGVHTRAAAGRCTTGSTQTS